MKKYFRIKLNKKGNTCTKIEHTFFGWVEQVNIIISRKTIPIREIRLFGLSRATSIIKNIKIPSVTMMIKPLKQIKWLEGIW